MPAEIYQLNKWKITLDIFRSAKLTLNNLIFKKFEFLEKRQIFQKCRMLKKVEFLKKKSTAVGQPDCSNSIFLWIQAVLRTLIIALSKKKIEKFS